MEQIKSYKYFCKCKNPKYKRRMYEQCCDTMHCECGGMLTTNHLFNDDMFKRYTNPNNWSNYRCIITPVNPKTPN